VDPKPNNNYSRTVAATDRQRLEFTGKLGDEKPGSALQPEVQFRVNSHQNSSLGAETLNGISDRIASQPNEPPKAAGAISIWARRLSLVIFVVFCVEMGMLLVVLPWTPVWNENSLLLNYPSLRAFAQQNFVRGAITGLGLVDIWMGIWEAVLYREKKKK
jgi:hypothetical protein